MDPASPELKHSFSTDSDAAAGAIRKSFRFGRVFGLEDLVNVLQSQGDGLWHEFLRLLQSQELPNFFDDFCKLSHVFEVVKPVLEGVLLERRAGANSSIHFDPNGKRKHRLVIGVDSPQEWRIHDRTRQILQKHSSIAERAGRPVLMHLSPFSRISSARRGNRSAWYELGSGPWHESDQCACCSDGPITVLQLVFGSGFAARLAGWFAEEGLSCV